MSFRGYFNKNIFNKDKVEEGIWLKFLSDSSFSNIFRISRNGWNAPFGKRSKDEINNESFNLIKERLNTTKIFNESFENIEYQKNSFIFFDPPYLNTNNGLYNKLWDKDKLEKLVDTIKSISIHSYFIYTDIENEINLKLLDCENIESYNINSNKITSGKYAGAVKKEMKEVYYTNIPLKEIKLW
jgi:site-specific DNA-adenine methylase